jgi:hypothetical protein
MPTAVALDIRRAAKKSNHKERKDHEEVGAKTLHAVAESSSLWSSSS